MTTQPQTIRHEPVDFWSMPAVVCENHFVHKSLSSWAFNPAVGCSHACLFCYVPNASTIKLGTKLACHGVRDPDAEWGDYLMVRPWNEKKFLASLRAAERRPLAKLNFDGNRAIIYSSTTDSYQNVVHAAVERQKLLASTLRNNVRRSLELIRDRSTLNVRILTRSPLARADFDLFQSFRSRLVFGMSLPTLRDDLSRVYEPRAPRPSQRLATLRAAKEAGLHVYVAIAPTYPECDEQDLGATLRAVRELDPITIFHEPINMRAENVARIARHAQDLGVKLNTNVFDSPESWRKYALGALRTAERLAGELGIQDRLHLWPDKSLGSKAVMKCVANGDGHRAWLERWWSRVSEWPTTDP
jgi:DNA repair photolyase